MKEKILANPKMLFVIDGFGAMLSAFLLGFVLVTFESLIGIPSKTLYVLASIPICYIFYDVYSYNLPTQKVSVFLKGIAILNMLYCFISIGFAYYHMNTITMLGCLYIIVEIMILGILISVQYRIAKMLAKKQKN